MSSRQQLLDSLTAHISLYHSKTAGNCPDPNPSPRSAILRWFSSLSVHQRRAHLTILDANFVAILIQMEEKLRSNGCGRFIILPDLPQNDGSALPTLCYRKSEGLLSRFSESNVAEREIRDSVELFSSVEGEKGGGEGGFVRLDAACSAQGLVEDVSRFVDVVDEITNGEFLRGGEEAEMVGEWAELGWLKAKGYYSLEEFVVNRMEVALRLAWLNSNGGKKRGVKLKERLSAAGVAANVFWRKKGCVDWWEKLDDSVKKKVYCTYLGKAARLLTSDVVKGKVSYLDDKMLCCDYDKHLMRCRCESDSLGIRDLATGPRTSSKIRLKAKPAAESGGLSPVYQILNSLYILQFVSTLLYAAQFGSYKKENIFFSSLDSVKCISDIILRKMRHLLMVISLDCTKFELLGEENTGSCKKKLNEKHAANNRKKKGKNHNKKSNPVQKPSQENTKPIVPAKGKELCISNEDVKQSDELDCEVQQKDLAQGNHPSVQTTEPVKGVKNGKVRSASRKSRKERKKLKSSGSNVSEVGSCQSGCTRVSSPVVSSQDGTSMPNWTSEISTFDDVSNNSVIQIDRLVANSNLSSSLGAENIGQRVDSYSTNTDAHLCNVSISAAESGTIRPTTTENDYMNNNLDSVATTVETVVEFNDNMSSKTSGRGTHVAGYLGKQMKGCEPEGVSSRVQEQENPGLLRVGAINSPAYISYEWPNTAPLHPLVNANHPATTDRLHLDVGRNLQNRFHHSFVQTLQVRNSPIDNAYNGIISRPLPMSLDWPPTVRGFNRLVTSSTCSYDSEFISRRQSSFLQSMAAHGVQSGAAISEDGRTISSELMELPDVLNPPELTDEHDKNWMSEEELENQAVGMDYNQYFGGGVMYWNPSDHPGATFSRPPSLCSDDSSWAWREADMNRDVDDMVAFSSSYSTNGITSPSAGSFVSPFDPLGAGPLNYVMPGSEISSKVLHSSSTLTDIGADESVSGSVSNISGDGDVTAVDSLPYPILRPIIIPTMSRERSRSEFKRSYDHKSPCVPPNRRDQPRIKRPPSPVVLCVPRAPHPPPPSPVGDSRKHRGFHTVRSGSSSPRHWGVKGWFHDGVNFEETCMPMEGSEVIWPSWRNKGLSSRQMMQPLSGKLLQDRLIAISQLARDQEHPDITFPLQPPESQNNSTRKASLSLIHDILHDEINSFCKQVAAENFIRKPYINWAVKRVARSLQVLWPRARTNIYGSNATGLSLPSSDVDLVVSLPPVRNLEPIKEAGILEGRNGIKETCLQHAARYLANQEWVKSDSLKIVENTAIPIIMLVVEVPCDLISASNVQPPKDVADKVAFDKGKAFQSDAGSTESTSSPTWSKIGNDNNDEFKSVRLDISFKSSTHTGLQTTGLVKDLTERFPAVTPLSWVLKQFLADRSLDQSYSGGLSSYCLILLITRFLQHEHHHGRAINQLPTKIHELIAQYNHVTENYGSLLMDFLYFFGNVFHPRQMRISVQGSGIYLNRERGCNIDPLCIDDPLFLTNNVGRNCFRIHQCIKAFADAYAMLENELTCLDDGGIDAKPTGKLLPKLIPSIGQLFGS